MIDVAVVGSLHLDIMVKAPRLPGPDETLMGSGWNFKCGGKGGNQAVAAARWGARTAFGGAVGNDDFGKRLRKNLEAAGVDTSHVLIDREHGSGMSVAIEEADGEYGAVVVSGANAAIEANSILQPWKPLWDCKVLLLQNEIPEAVNLVAARAATSAKAVVVLNAAPTRSIPKELLDEIDLLVVNRVEAAMLTGSPVKTIDDAREAAQKLTPGYLAAVVTLGRDGLVFINKDGGPGYVPPTPVKAVSSHGAGDCFCGALAASLAKGGSSIEEACVFASAAAAEFVSTVNRERPSVRI